MKARVLSTLLLTVSLSFGQDSVDVVFRFTPPTFPAGGVFVPGEFNGWNQSLWPMQFIGGPWIRQARLALNGRPTPGGVPYAWQYKFFYSGVSVWPNDPLNHHVNVSDNNNSYIIARDPTFYQFLPNQRQPLVTTSTPIIYCYIYPKVGTTIDTSMIILTIDGSSYIGLGTYYNLGSKQFVFQIPSPLSNGNHVAILTARTHANGINADTVTFYIQSGFAQITTQGGYATRNPQRQLRGIIQDTSIHIAQIIRNGTDTTSVSVSAGGFSATVALVEGENTFRVRADSNGTPSLSDPVTFSYIVNHSPNAQITYLDAGSTITLQGISSTDPDSGQTATLSFLWYEDPTNPAPIGEITGSTSPSIVVTRPQVSGEYFFDLIAMDIDGNKDTTRNYFILGASPPIITPSLASVPRWVREGRMYLMFFKMHTAAGTINAAYPDLDRIAAMGYNILWIMPVMQNRDPINNGGGPGYNITDFYNVATEYGTNLDFRNFAQRAHQLGMKLILDVTPSHTSSAHPFVADARAFRDDSRYWTYYQHALIPYSGPPLGELSQSITPDGFVYYGPFSDAILNYNWADLDARQYMIDVYKWWIKDMEVDGFRLDVYWGPHTRANSPAGGEGEMGRPVRTALKHVRPDIHLLGEALGVGAGTERLYADNSDFRGPGGVDAAYD